MQFNERFTVECAWRGGMVGGDEFREEASPSTSANSDASTPGDEDEYDDEYDEYDEYD